jgi:maleate isomerase
LALGACDPQSDGVTAACLNFAHMSSSRSLRRGSVNVVTSTQAALWRLLRLAGVDTLIDGFGRLMQEF